jgi:hypothetical protein
MYCNEDMIFSKWLLKDLLLGYIAMEPTESQLILQRNKPLTSSLQTRYTAHPVSYATGIKGCSPGVKQ